MTDRSGILLHGAFLEDGARLGIAEGLEPFAPDVFEKVYRMVSGLVRLHGTDLQRIMDGGDLEPIALARRDRSWFPEREFGLFFDSWVAVPVRLRSAMRYLETYSASGMKDSEEVIFGFFTNSVATLDSFSFALYSIGGMLQPRNFPTATDRDRQRITWRSTESTYGKFFGATQVAKLLARIGGSGEYRALTTLRNVLAHRASPAFRYHADYPGIEFNWVVRGHVGQDLEFTPEVMAGEASWLRSTLAELLAATAIFVETQWGYRGAYAS